MVAAGYEREVAPYALGVPVYAHAGGIFPRIAIVSSEGGNGDLHGLRNVRDLAIKVESAVAFSRAHDLGLELLGHPLGPYRSGVVSGKRTRLVVLERRAYLGFEPFPGDLAREGRMGRRRYAMPWTRATFGPRGGGGSMTMPKGST